MKKHTKLLVILLSVAIVCTGLIMAVSADGSNGQASYTDSNGGTVTGTLADALANVPAGGTVKLEGDCTLSSTITVAKSFAVDLNGYKLTATANDGAFKIGANNVTFTIKGNGALVLSKALVSSTKDYTGFTVNVTGDDNTPGISINHSGYRITNTTHGTWNFKNLDVVSTSVLPESDAYFMTERVAGASANLSFTNVLFDNRTVPHQTDSGNKIVSIAGTGSVSIVDSAFYTQNSGIYAAYAKNGGKVTGNITIEGSVISCLGNPVSGRNYVVLGQHHDFGAEGNGFNGTITIKNSHVECNVRMFTCGNNDVFTLNVDNSTLKIAGNSGTDTAYGFTRGSATKNFTNNSRILFRGASAGTVPAGTRSNRLGAIAAASGCTIIYDPIGDPEAPYLVVESGTASSPDFYKNYSFDLLSFTTATPGERVLRTAGAYKSGWATEENFKNEAGGMQWDIKLGTLTHVQAPTNNYVRYWIEDDDNNDTTTTRYLNNDPYFIMGLDSSGQKTENGGAYLSSIAGANRKKVMVSEVDFATDSEAGYPRFTIQIQTRGTTKDGNDKPISLSPVLIVGNDGSVDNRLPTDNSGVTLNPTGMWNRMSVVVVTDPVNTQALAYMYINGEYIGSTPIVADTTATNQYFQGIRFNIEKNKNYNVGASLCIDNVSFRCYTDYQFEGETDYIAATDEAEEIAAVYYPERYIQGAPAHIYVSANNYVNSDAINVNDALANATANGADLDLKGDVKLPQLIKTNGIVSTNGYILNVDPASYGCTVSYDANGNAVYTFNEATDKALYNGTVKYHFYAGNDYVNYSDNVYQTVEFAIGQNVTTAIKNYFGTFTNNGRNLTVRPQLAWDKTLVVTPEGLVNGEVYVYPVFANNSITVTNSYVKNAVGRIISIQNTNNEAKSAYNSIKDGETIVLLSDLTLSDNGTFYSDAQTTTVDGKKYVNGVHIDNDYTEAELATMKEVAQVLGIDTNGYNISTQAAQLVVAVGSNTIVNLYSSNPGSEITAWRANGSTNKLEAWRIFAIGYNGDTGSSKTHRDNTFNAYLNIGSENGHQITVLGESIAEGLAGDNSCTITVDNVIYGSVVSNSASLSVYTRYYDGNIILKNSLIFAATTVETHIVSIKADTDIAYHPYILFDSCILLNTGTAKNITDANGTGEGTHIEFVNCTSNGRLNCGTGERNQFGYGNAATYLHPADAPQLTDDNLVRAYYNQPMTLDGFLPEGQNYLKFKIPQYVPATDSAAAYLDTSKYFYVANYGCADDIADVTDAKSKIVLPLLTEKLVNKNETVNVTWQKADGTTVSQRYVKGANVLAQEQSGDRKSITAISAGASQTLNALKVDVTGWPTLPTNIQENTTIKAIYTVESLLKNTDLKVNLTLTSDFTINAYIPAIYNDYIKVTSGGAELDKVIVNKGTEEAPNEYTQVSVSVASTKASEDVVFTIVITEGNFTATVTATTSILRYAYVILSDVSSQYDADDYALMYYMLNYAKEAVKYFNGADAEAIADIDAVMSLYTGNALTIDKTYGDAKKENLTAFKNATVSLDSTPAFVFALKDNFVGTVTITDGVNTKTYEFAEGNTNVEIKHVVNVYNFTQTLTVIVDGTVTTDDGVIEINESGNYNFASFANYHTENANNPNSETAAASNACLDVIGALYDYAKVANWYKNGTLAEKLA